MLDCISYLTQYLYIYGSRHFTGLCISVHSWERVSEIRTIKESLSKLEFKTLCHA